MEQMALRLIWVGTPLALMGIASLFVVSRIFERVNQQLPEQEQIEFFGRWPGKVSRVRKLYRKYYPDSHLVQWEIGLEISVLLWAVIALWLMR